MKEKKKSFELLTSFPFIIDQLTGSDSKGHLVKNSIYLLNDDLWYALIELWRIVAIVTLDTPDIRNKYLGSYNLIDYL